ncbi:lysine exporter LysO family protein [Crassaminicella profunda]|uniref:lysine exporter LysO family protein n=1 Tax=Crassaminicella profunda TaxID=1286698 RepID=UPI001CA69A8B|nr:lysine exporter LysO family protein [Crassaminicella profunda]QZY54434.1 lysine exporter LysO family protein [Crassaminicella profunda]
MTILPFICLGIGFIVGFQKMTDKFLKTTDFIVNITLIVLMLTIGMNIGVNNSIMSKLNMIGINCFVIALLAIIFSVIFTLLVEKTILPLDKIRENLNAENMNLDNEVNVSEEEKKELSPLVLIMPLSIALGVILGYFVMPKEKAYLLGYILTATLIFLYIGVGISLGNNRSVFKYIKVLGVRIIFISLAIFLGSIAGGFIAGSILNLPPEISVMSSSGMSYYSLTGAYMTKVYGIEIGTYGFVVNVMREFFTVLLLPLLIKISKGSPIAGGAAGNMDTMLMPITKFVGPELGLVTLITGTILTFAVPFVLPILYGVFQ